MARYWREDRQASPGLAEQGVVFCWTGTGVCIAANKVPRCSCGAPLGRGDCEGGEALDDANVLAMC